MTSNSANTGDQAVLPSCKTRPSVRPSGPVHVACSPHGTLCSWYYSKRIVDRRDSTFLSGV